MTITCRAGAITYYCNTANGARVQSVELILRCTTWPGSKRTRYMSRPWYGNIPGVIRLPIVHTTLEDSIQNTHWTTGHFYPLHVILSYTDAATYVRTYTVVREVHWWLGRQ
jgi:hypothetical protein